MKKAQREIYLVLATEPLPRPFYSGLGLCNLCQFAEWSGCWRKDSDLTCHHPIWAVQENADEVWAGSDCWGFRPEYSLEDTVDKIGVCLQGHYPDMSKCKIKKAYKERIMACD